MCQLPVTGHVILPILILRVFALTSKCNALNGEARRCEHATMRPTGTNVFFMSISQISSKSLTRKRCALLYKHCVLLKKDKLSVQPKQPIRIERSPIIVFINEFRLVHVYV